METIHFHIKFVKLWADNSVFNAFFGGGEAVSDAVGKFSY